MVYDPDIEFPKEETKDPTMPSQKDIIRIHIGTRVRESITQIEIYRRASNK